MSHRGSFAIPIHSIDYTTFLRHFWDFFMTNLVFFMSIFDKSAKLSKAESSRHEVHWQHLVKHTWVCLPSRKEILSTLYTVVQRVQICIKAAAAFAQTLNKRRHDEALLLSKFPALCSYSDFSCNY